jgi:hypothetical protein
LTTTIEVDNAESAEPERHPIVRKVVLVVGSTVLERSRHSSCRFRSIATKTPGYSAHDVATARRSVVTKTLQQTFLVQR